MPIVLTEGVATKKTTSTAHAPRKVQPKTEEEGKALASEEEEEESSEETPQSCSDLPVDFCEGKKIARKKKGVCDIPVYEEYLPGQEEQLENKVRWLIDQQLSKHQNTLAKNRNPSSSSDLDSTSASEGESLSDDSEKSLPHKKMKSSKTKKHSSSKKKKRPKKSKKTSSSSANQKQITKLVSLLAKAIKK